MSRRAIALAALAVLLTVAVVNARTTSRSRPPVRLGATELRVLAVDASAYVVTADLRVANPGGEPLSVVALTSPGLAISARGGLPETVPAGGSLVLRVHVEIPRCATLPSRLGGFEVQLARGSERADVGYLSEPGSALYRELAALADRICGAYPRG